VVTAVRDWGFLGTDADSPTSTRFQWNGGHEEGKTPEPSLELTRQMACLRKTLSGFQNCSPRGHLSMSNLESPEQPRKARHSLDKPSAVTEAAPHRYPLANEQSVDHSRKYSPVTREQHSLLPAQIASPAHENN
jgi:hypothetical protein